MLKKNEKEPFFHILQPTIQFPKANMQEVYTNKKEEDDVTPHSSHTLLEPDEMEEKEGSPAHLHDSGEVQNEEVKESTKATEIIEEFEAENRETQEDKPFTPHIKKMPSLSFKRLKSFKEMNTEERLNYLLNFPKQLPPVPCMFETDASSFRGVLIGKTEEMIEIKLLDGKTKELHIQSIKEIRMVGLRK
ncbi:CotO family spore coat protein [Bacillus sp. JJ1532]|uniref:CotO family spore coat protein n=1 Tax=Bacillus sp. JJ1532 TaxID=3122958 RepID=UPI0030001D9F